MPPRPRPRPRAQPVAPAPARPEAPSAEARRKRAKQEEDDEDAMFMRNRGPGRSLKEVNKRAERAAALASQTSSSPVGSDEEDEDEDTPKQGLAKKRKQNTSHAGKGNALPKWAKKGAISTLFDSDSESENNHPSAYDGTPSKKRRTGASGSNAPTPTGKRNEHRARSRSLTPPPDLTLAQKLSAQQAIQKALSSDNEEDDMRASPSPVEIEDDEDDVEDTRLDPELERIILERASKHKTGYDYGSTQRARPGMVHHGSSSGPPDVAVRVKWVAHPEDDAVRDRPQPTWSFVMKRHHSLKELFFQTSEKAQILMEDLVLLREGKQMFSSVSLDGLNVWDHVDLEGCDRATFEALRSRHRRSATPAQENADEDSEHENEREASAAPSEASVEPGDADSRFKLILRAHGHKDITLTVRPTTSCGKIVRAFLATTAKHGGTVPASPRKVAQVRLCIDGDKQGPDTPIAECELEDGDMVEVVGL